MGFELDLVLTAKHFIGAAVSVVWGILMLHLTLGKHRKTGKKMLGFYIGVFAVVMLLMCGATWATQYMRELVWEMPDELYYNVAYNMGTSFLWMLTDMTRMLLPAVGIIFVAVVCFTNDRSAKIFMAILIVLAALILNGYIAQLMIFPKVFNAETVEDVGLIGYTLIRLLLFATAYFVYKKYLKGKMLEMLEAAEGQLRPFVRVPVISCIAFSTSLSFLTVMDATLLSDWFMNQAFWFVMLGMLILVYIWMYWGIFKAVTLATESMKTKAELDVASKIQASVLPRTFPAFPECDRFDIYATMTPAKEVGGDFYDFFMLDENRLAVVIADVSGKGVPAALFMMSARTMIKNQSFIETDPARALGIVNSQLAENNEEGMFVTVFLGIVDLRTKELTYSNGGHNPPYIVRADGTVEQLQVRPGFVLGGMEGIRYRNQSALLDVNDKLLLYTDGVTEAVNPGLELYGERRLEETLAHTEKLPPKPCIEKILSSLTAFADGAEQADDITMVVLQIFE